jgi:hypothetical protein
LARSYLARSISVSRPFGGGADGLLSADIVAKVGEEELVSKNAQQSNRGEWIFASTLRIGAWS